MEEVLYSVKLADGTTFENLKREGNCFVSSEPIDQSKFKGNCAPVTISDGEFEEIHTNMRLSYFGQWEAPIVPVTVPSMEEEYKEPEPQQTYVFVLEDLYSVELSDGTTFDNLAMNGNHYISKELVEASMFDANCSPVTIRCNGNEEVHDNMELVLVTQIDGDYWFVLRDLTAEELNRIKLRSDVDYIAMMANVEL